MRRMLSEKQVQYLRNKQDKLIAGDNITISDSNVISATVPPVPQFANVLDESPALSASSYIVFSDFTSDDLDNCISFTITVNIGNNGNDVWVSSTFSGLITSDSSISVSIGTIDGEVLLVIEESESTLYNNTQSSTINDIIIDKLY